MSILLELRLTEMQIFTKFSVLKIFKESYLDIEHAKKIISVVSYFKFHRALENFTKLDRRA